MLGMKIRQRPLRIGLTGGMGAGKSTVATIFSMLEIPIYYADQGARRLMESDHDLKNKIVDLLGPEAYHGDGRLNRKWIASRIFDDDDLLTRLNYLVHPAVDKDSRAWHSDLALNVPFSLREAALTFESGQYLHLDAVISVEAPYGLRIDRVMARDMADREAVKARMQHQWPDDRRRMMADFIIENDGRQAMIPQIVSIYRELTYGRS